MEKRSQNWLFYSAVGILLCIACILVVLLVGQRRDRVQEPAQTSTPRPAPTQAEPIRQQPTPIPLPTTVPQSQATTCNCSGDLYNCTDGSFATKREAQACYDHCRSIGRGDIHDLDRDDDGEACDTGVS